MQKPAKVEDLLEQRAYKETVEFKGIDMPPRDRNRYRVRSTDSGVRTGMQSNVQQGGWEKNWGSSYEYSQHSKKWVDSRV